MSEKLDLIITLTRRVDVICEGGDQTYFMAGVLAGVLRAVACEKLGREATDEEVIELFDDAVATVLG